MRISTGPRPRKQSCCARFYAAAEACRGVEEAAIGDEDALPLGHSNPGQLPLVREGLNEDIDTMDNQAPEIHSPIVSPEYFHLLGMPLLRGRLFSDHDLESTPQVAVINQAAARMYWPNQDPLGKRVRLHLDSRELLNTAKPAWTTIVGVIADARTESLADAATPQIYRSVYQHPAKSLAIFLRGQLDPSAILSQERTQVQAVDPDFPSSVRRRWRTCSPPRFPSGDSRWKWWRFLRSLPCCWPGLESTGLSPML